MPADDPAATPVPSEPRRRRRLRTLSIRGLLVLVALVALPLGYKARRASVQRRAVAAVQRLGGQVTYDWEQSRAEGRTSDTTTPPAPAWLRRWLGDAFFQEVVGVELSTSNQEHLATLPPPPTTGHPQWAGMSDGEIRQEWAKELVTADQLACLDGLDRLNQLELDHLTLDRIGRERLARLASIQSIEMEGRIATEDLAALARLPRLRELSLTDYDFPKWSPAAPPLPHLRKLTVFGLSGDPGLDWICRHRDLDELMICSGGVGDAVLDRLTALPHLARLECWRAEDVTDAGLATLTRLGELRSVDFWEAAKITDAGLAHLTRMPRLEEVILTESGKITDAGLAHLARLPHLHKVRIRTAEGITDAGLAHIGRARELRSIELGFAEGITDAGLAHLAGLNELEDFDFRSAPGITDAGLAILADKTHLRYIILGSAGITDAGLVHLAGLKNLEMLSLSQATGITDAGLVRLIGLDKLEFLGLQSSTRITDAGLVTLAKFPKLHTLRLHKSQVTAAGMAALKSGRPGFFDDVEINAPASSTAPANTPEER